MMRYTVLNVFVRVPPVLLCVLFPVRLEEFLESAVDGHMIRLYGGIS